MLNHFRTLLLNLDDINDTEEHITPSFKSKLLPNSLIAIYNILFYNCTDRTSKLESTQIFLNLIDGVNLNSEVLQYDPRISYDIRSISNFNATTNSLNIADLLIQLEVINPFSLMQQLSNLDISKYNALWDFDKNDITRLAALILAYVSKVNEL